MKKGRCICTTILALVLLSTAIAAPAAAADCDDGGCWKLRFGLNRTDGDDEILNVFPLADGGEERTKLGVTAGNGPAVSLEYLLNRRTGLEGSLCLTDLNALGVFDTQMDWDMTKQDLQVTTLAFGPNFHLTPDHSVDFYVGVFAALAMFDDLDYNLLGRQLRADFDDETGFGAQVGVDIPLGSSAWAVNLAARYMDLDADVGGDFPGSLSLSPIKALAGLTWTSGGKKPKCGDGEVNQDSEECDDGNLDNGDGCSAECKIEPKCGDGQVNQPGEECDDGNNDDGDGCSAECKIEPKCGDGKINQDSEECDDGNNRNGDGCSAECKIEPKCGDGEVNQASEECDDGNNRDGDGCSATCKIEKPKERRETCVFESGSARVDNICKAKLDEVGLSMVNDPSLIAMVSGYSDSRGSEKSNMQASAKRAEAVKKYLVERYGIDPSRITTEGRGAADPVASNDTVDGRAQNRRAEIVVKAR